ncbi:hypothetical protein ADEAN_000941000 [Angomonas deanei]|uniref:Uncharacterized protein n=1 Tax=Angomonas deanei TaxID=59799 RepID=A0A7G2CQW1_9TRYP|nr:hypothetical protein ADEAN_000941000 [Angomonas deanei]
MAEVKAEEAEKAREELLARMYQMRSDADFQRLQNEVRQYQLKEEWMTKSLQEAQQAAQTAQEKLRAIEESAEKAKQEFNQAFNEQRMEIALLRGDLQSCEQRLQIAENNTAHQQSEVQQRDRQITLLNQNLQAAQHSEQQTRTRWQEAYHEHLMNPNTQQALRDMYPDDTLLQEQSNLVELLREREVEKAKEIDAKEAEINKLKTALRQKESLLTKEVYARQEALMELAKLQVLEGKVRMPSQADTQMLQRIQNAELDLQARQYHLELLEKECKEGKKREEDLMRKVEQLSYDPVSACARKYGLTACRTFEGQIQELHEKSETLYNNMLSHLEEIRGLKQSMLEKDNALQENAQRVSALQAELEKQKSIQADLEAAVRQAREKESHLEATIAQEKEENVKKENALAALSAELQQSQHAVQRLEASLTDCRAEREQFYKDNLKLIKKARELHDELMKAEESSRAAREQLKMAHSAGGARARRQMNQSVSLTRDLLGTPNPPQ